MKHKGVHFLELVKLLNKHGFPNLEALNKLEANPMKWTPNQWSFATELIAISTGLTVKKVKEKLSKPRDFFMSFNESLRQCGLLVELQEQKPITDRNQELHSEIFWGKRGGWAEEWINDVRG